MARPVAIRDGPRAKGPRASSNHYSLVSPILGIYCIDIIDQLKNEACQSRQLEKLQLSTLTCRKVASLASSSENYSHWHVDSVNVDVALFIMPLHKPVFSKSEITRKLAISVIMNVKMAIGKTIFLGGLRWSFCYLIHVYRSVCFTTHSRLTRWIQNIQWTSILALQSFRWSSMEMWA